MMSPWEPKALKSYFLNNPNGEAEVLRVILKPKPRIKKLVFEQDMSELAIKGRQSMGNILTKYEVHKITLHERGYQPWGPENMV
jgi:topoisomerase IV subunit A